MTRYGYFGHIWCWFLLRQLFENCIRLDLFWTVRVSFLLFFCYKYIGRVCNLTELLVKVSANNGIITSGLTHPSHHLRAQIKNYHVTLRADVETMLYKKKCFNKTLAGLNFSTVEPKLFETNENGLFEYHPLNQTLKIKNSQMNVNLLF